MSSKELYPKIELIFPKGTNKITKSKNYKFFDKKYN
jgi:hypothetical protein